MATIHAIETALPQHTLTNDEACDIVGRAFVQAGERAELVEGIFRNADIDKRHLARPVSYYFEHQDLTHRNQTYAEVAKELGLEAAQKALDAAGLHPQDIDLIIDTSCTGLMIPALDAYIANTLGMRKDVRRMPLNAVGCAGGAVALSRAADHLRAYPQANVLCLTVELPSLTLQLGDLSRANLVSSAIFGDGAAAAIVSNAPLKAPGFDIEATRSVLFPDSTEVMGFELRSEGFKIILSRRIPLLVRQRLRGEVDEFLGAQGLSRAELGFHALHPGGTKVLDNMREVFEIDEAAVAASRTCLREFGNLSSASVLFVARELRERGLEDGQRGILAAMGPGFAAELSLLTARRPS